MNETEKLKTNNIGIGIIVATIFFSLFTGILSYLFIVLLLSITPIIIQALLAIPYFLLLLSSYLLCFLIVFIFMVGNKLHNKVKDSFFSLFLDSLFEGFFILGITIVFLFIGTLVVFVVIATGMIHYFGLGVGILISIGTASYLMDKKNEKELKIVKKKKEKEYHATQG